jgi:Flp pilus assembly pilin Flp
MNSQSAKMPAKKAPAPVTTDDASGTSLWTICKRIHADERGAVSIETILIIAAIALPILIFIIKFGWPRIRTFFNEGMDELEGGAVDAAGGE